MSTSIRTAPTTTTSTFDGFAVVADEAPHATAVFLQLEDAIVWALERFGSDRFRIRQLALVEVAASERTGATGPT